MQASKLKRDKERGPPPTLGLKQTKKKGVGYKHVTKELHKLKNFDKTV